LGTSISGCLGGFLAEVTGVLLFDFERDLDLDFYNDLLSLFLLDFLKVLDFMRGNEGLPLSTFFSLIMLVSQSFIIIRDLLIILSNMFSTSSRF